MTYETILKLWDILNLPNARTLSLVVSAAQAAAWGVAADRLRRRSSIDLDITINPRRKVVRSRSAIADDMVWTPQFESWLAEFLRQEAIETEMAAIRQRRDDAWAAQAAAAIDQKLS